MKAQIILPLLGALLSCNIEDPKFIRKKIVNKEITVKWFYYSYITNTSPDFVVIEKNGIAKEIYKAESVIVDVSLHEHDIILKLFRPSNGIVFTKQVEKVVFGYNIVLDSTATIEQVSLIPDGVKEKILF